MWDLRWIVKGFSLCVLISPLEQASCYSLSPLMVFLEQASCYSLSPLMVFLIARVAIFSPRNFISLPGHYLILSKDWACGAPAPGERIQGAAK